MKVLIVDDRPDTIKDIQNHCDDKNWESKLISFDNFDECLETFMPDAIVLDWKDGADGESRGEDVIDKIWSNGFKPIIIFSAIAGTIDLNDKYKASNLIQLQPKGDEQPVIDYLDKICPFVPTITKIKEDFNIALLQALNSIDMMSNLTHIPTENVMRYIFAKRVSTYYDKECVEDKPPAWIQYIYPAIFKTLCVCDLIRKIPDNKVFNTPGNPEDYYIILTPSCDIAQNKVTQILCATCCTNDKFHLITEPQTPRTENQLSKQRDKVKIFLNTGYNNNCVALPCIPNVFPGIAVNLKQLVLCPINEIALNQTQISESSTYKYYRLASIDSPFKEQIVWAHMLNACRPGMPDRDMDLWAKEMIPS